MRQLVNRQRGIGPEQLPQLHQATRPTAFTINAVRSGVWKTVQFIVGITALVHFILDPRPNLLLAVCSAANVGIFLYAIIKLYERDLLLSNMGAIYLGAGWIIFYSFGNLGTRIAGDLRYNGNPGSLDYYPLVALLTTIGLLVVTIIVIGLFAYRPWFYRFRYQDLTWTPLQLLGIVLVTLASFQYLSSKYILVAQNFANVSGLFDVWLSSSIYMFVVLTAVVGTSVFVKWPYPMGKLLGATAIFLSLLITVGLESRTLSIVVAIIIGSCMITLRPDRTKITLAFGVVTAVFLYALTSLIKVENYNTVSIAENLQILSTQSSERVRTQFVKSIGFDGGYRMAGFEMSAAILKSYLEFNISPMYGKALKGGLRQGMPDFLRLGSGPTTERQAIGEHFVGRGGMSDTEVMSVTLASGLADFGVIGWPMIYVILGLYTVIMWRIGQTRLLLFLANLIAGIGTSQTARGVGDLFWQHAFSYAIKYTGFAILALMLLYPIVMPKHDIQPTTQDARRMQTRFRT